MRELSDPIVIGISGIAFSGKDTFCLIAKNILEQHGYRVGKYSFADQMKKDVAPFLKEKCGVDVWTNDTELKTDFRDFLVWYGTTWWRKREPDRWIKRVELQVGANNADVVFVSDVRYPDEADWIHSYGKGWLIHIASYKSITDGLNRGREFDNAPNEQERINDPILENKANYKLEWKKQGIKNLDEGLHNTYLVDEVTKCLKACPYLTIPKV
jgi:hypothetical protein